MAPQGLPNLSQTLKHASIGSQVVVENRSHGSLPHGKHRTYYSGLLFLQINPTDISDVTIGPSLTIGIGLGHGREPVVTSEVSENEI